MSKLKFQSNVSGTGVITVESPNTDSDGTLTLPTGTATLSTKENLESLQGHNHVINGDFDIWQRGTTAVTANDTCAADRWEPQSVGSSHSVTQQSFALGQTDVPGEPEFYMRHDTTSVAGATNYSAMLHKIEDVRTGAGGDVTVSFWIKTDASDALSGDSEVSVLLAQYFGTGGSPSAEVKTVSQNITITTSWVKHTLTFALPPLLTDPLDPSTSKTIGSDGNDFMKIQFSFDIGSSYSSIFGGLGQQSGIVDIAQVQLEVGATATAFEQRSHGEELALCQRYFWEGKKAARGVGEYWSGSSAAVYSGGLTSFPVTMRIVPTIDMTTTATYKNSVHYDYQATTVGFDQRLLVSSAGLYRAYDGIYSADAEL